MSHPVRFSVPAGAWDTHVHLFDDPPPMIVHGKAIPFPHAPPGALDAMHQAIGIERAVIVDGELGGNAVLLAQLQAGEGRYRGVAKFKSLPSRAELVQLHNAGVRGCRFYFHEMLGPSASHDDYKRIADLVAPFGWHTLIFTTGEDLIANERLWRESPVPIVLDHLCFLDLEKGLDQPALALILDLQRTRETYVKISGGDRRSNDGPPDYEDDVPLVRRVIENAPSRVVWATDWPFVMYKRPGLLGHPPPAPSDLMRLLMRYCRSQGELDMILRDTPDRLYS